MLRLSDMDSVGRAVRQDDSDDLGIPTSGLIGESALRFQNEIEDGESFFLTLILGTTVCELYQVGWAND